jgi:hypothetical protein
MTSGVTPDPDMVTRSTLTFFRRQPHDPDAGLRQARSCLREIVPVSMDEMTLPNAARRPPSRRWPAKRYCSASPRRGSHGTAATGSALARQQN